MKNQYVGDVGDYGKYGLLRFFIGQGIRVGVNWYLTPNDGSGDGGHTKYLNHSEMRMYDPNLFDFLRTIVDANERTVQMVEQSGILKNAVFYHEQMNFDSMPWQKRTEAREQWHQEALAALNGADLIFADPDNGLSDRKPSLKYTQKFILPHEVQDYYRQEKQVVYYHHRPRKNKADWLADKTRMKQFLPDARLLAISFNRWTCRSYIFVLHPEEFERYRKAVHQFLSSVWGTKTVNGKCAFQFDEI